MQGHYLVITTVNEGEMTTTYVRRFKTLEEAFSYQLRNPGGTIAREINVKVIEQ